MVLLPPMVTPIVCHTALRRARGLRQAPLQWSTGTPHICQTYLPWPTGKTLVRQTNLRGQARTPHVRQAPLQAPTDTPRLSRTHLPRQLLWLPARGF